MLRISRFAGYVLLAGSALFVLSAMLAVPPPPLTALRNISIPVDAQIKALVFSAPKKPGELRLAFMSNCLFQGAVRNGARTAKLPVGLTIVGRFENWVSRQPELAQLPVSVFNASMDGTAILDHIAMTHKLAQYGVDVLVIAMAYTEFRRLPLHPQLGNLKESLTQHGVERADIDDLSKSRGRVLSMDFQRWVTARKFDFYNANPMLVNVLLWNYDVPEREQLEIDGQGRIRQGRSVASDWLRQFVYDSRLLSLVVLRLRTVYLNLSYKFTTSSRPPLYASTFYTREVVDHTRRALERFSDICAANDLDAAVLIIPDKDQVYKPFANEQDRHRPNRVLSGLLDELHVPHVDALPHLLRSSQAAGDPLYNMTQAGHLSVRGHRVVAQLLQDFEQGRRRTIAGKRRSAE